jgi:general secretion pathway protein I
MRRRGFTLLEVMVATLVMGIAVVGMLSALSASMRNAARLTEYDRAVMLSRAKMDELLLDSHFPLDMAIRGNFDASLMGGLQGGWSALLTRFEMPPKPIVPGSKALERMQLEIWWMVDGRRRTFTLAGYRAQTIKPEEVGP